MSKECEGCSWYDPIGEYCFREPQYDHYYCQKKDKKSSLVILDLINGERMNKLLGATLVLGSISIQIIAITVNPLIPLSDSFIFALFSLSLSILSFFTGILFLIQGGLNQQG